jgi:hypothetical protein
MFIEPVSAALYTPNLLIKSIYRELLMAIKLRPFAVYLAKFVLAQMFASYAALPASPAPAASLRKLLAHIIRINKDHGPSSEHIRNLYYGSDELHFNGYYALFLINFLKSPYVSLNDPVKSYLKSRGLCIFINMPG